MPFLRNRFWMTCVENIHLRTTTAILQQKTCLNHVHESIYWRRFANMPIYVYNVPQHLYSVSNVIRNVNHVFKANTRVWTLIHIYIRVSTRVYCTQTSLHFLYTCSTRTHMSQNFCLVVFDSTYNYTVPDRQYTVYTQVEQKKYLENVR